MPEIRPMLIPGAETPEGQERIRKAVEARNDVDFRAFMMLRRLVEDGLLTRHGFVQFFKEEEDEATAKEYAKELDEEIREILRDRSNTNDEVLKALAGRPE